LKSDLAVATQLAQLKRLKIPIDQALGKGELPKPDSGSAMQIFSGFFDAAA
jgi:hypothetical protein